MIDSFSGRSTFNLTKNGGLVYIKHATGARLYKIFIISTVRKDSGLIKLFYVKIFYLKDELELVSFIKYKIYLLDEILDK